MSMTKDEADALERKLLEEQIAKGGADAAFARAHPTVDAFRKWLSSEVDMGTDLHEILAAGANMIGNLSSTLARTHAANCGMPPALAALEFQMAVNKVIASYLQDGEKNVVTETHMRHHGKPH